MASVIIWLSLAQLLCYAGIASSQLWPLWPKDFRWSMAGPVAGFHCLQITEPSEPWYHTWTDNYFCSREKINWKWSYSGPIGGMKCTQIHERADPHTWSDNYLCLPNNAPYEFRWNNAGTIAGLDCIQWNEGSDPHTWYDNYLCASKSEPNTQQPWPTWPTDFRWSMAGHVPGFYCLQITEPGEPSSHTWTDNYFCSRNRINWKWSYSGPIAGMKCTLITEPSDPHYWGDNYLCLPNDAPYEFRWNYAGALNGLDCIQWNEGSDPHTWHDNFLCAPLWISEANKQLPDPVFPNDFHWSYVGYPDGYDCMRINEPAEPEYTKWHDNYFCWKREKKHPGLKWSYSGPIAGMRCTLITEPSDPHYWGDNYLCIPDSSRLRFTWAYAGIPNGYSCVQWNEPSEYSYWHDNYLCREKCKLTKIEIIDDDAVKGVYEGTQVIGVATGGHCVGSSQHVIKLDKVDSVEESVGIELSETDEINWSLSASVQVEASTKFLGSGVSVTVGLETSIGGSKSYGKTDTKDFKEGSSSGVGHASEYSSPGAAITFGTTGRYKIDKSSTPIKMHYECPNGGTFVRDSTMKLRGTTYQAAHFETMIGKFNKEKCDADGNLPNCVKNLPYEYDNFFGDMTEVRNAFKRCFADGKGTISK